jgi:branched-chain amino acid transport system substrate-binding protein
VEGVRRDDRAIRSRLIPKGDATMKGWIHFSLKAASVLRLFFALVFLLPAVGAAQGAGPIRLGAVLTLSGKAGFTGPLVGEPMKEAMTAVVDEVNRQGGVLGRKVELFIENDEADPARAAAAAGRLIKGRKVSAIIGPSLADSALAMIPVCEEEEVPLIVTGPVVSPFKKWVFLLGAGGVRGAEHIADFAVHTLRAKRIAVIYGSAEYGTTGLRDFSASIKKHPGVSIVAQERFATTDNNVTLQLERIKVAGPDLIVIYTNGASAALIAKDYKQLGMTTPVLGSHGVPTSEFLALAGALAEEYKWTMIGDRIVVAGHLPPNDPYRKNLYDPFLKLMKERYGRSTSLSVYEGVAYDGIMVAIEALKAAGSDDRAALRDALERIRWEGFLGAFACSPHDHQGSPVDNSAEMMVRNGEYVPYAK